jgi:hypothetical protein
VLSFHLVTNFDPTIYRLIQAKIRNPTFIWIVIICGLTKPPEVVRYQIHLSSYVSKLWICLASLPTPYGGFHICVATLTSNERCWWFFRYSSRLGSGAGRTVWIHYLYDTKKRKTMKRPVQFTLVVLKRGISCNLHLSYWRDHLNHDTALTVLREESSSVQKIGDTV